MNESSPHGGPAPPMPRRRAPMGRHPRRTHYPNLSPTRPPAEPDAARVWDEWTDQRVEQLDLDLFDDDGRPLSRAGGDS